MYLYPSCTNFKGTANAHFLCKVYNHAKCAVSVPICWNGLTFEAFCANLLIIHIIELSTFVSEASIMATNYNYVYMEHSSHANFQVADSRKVFSH